jgi:hypothetical protein
MSLANSNRALRHGTRRYPIHCDAFVTCTLVYEGNGGWRVEKRGGGAGELVCLTLPEFEKGATGKRLTVEFAAALAVAQEDL